MKEKENTEHTVHDRLTTRLEEASRIVETWPEWKRNVLAGNVRSQSFGTKLESPKKDNQAS
jgi:hypothetical protein